MIEIDIPGSRQLQLEHLVLDYNGTLAVDGRLLPDVKDLLIRLLKKLEIHVVTADTFGQAATEVKELPVTLAILELRRQDQRKLDVIQELGSDSCVSIGNGRNDRLMLQEAALGIAVILEEGASSETIQAADVVCRSITDALSLLLEPKRLVATLRL